MRIVLLGAPGSGKGTQAKLLVEKYKIPHVSTGDLLRAAIAAGTELGRKIKSTMDAGQLVSDEIVLSVIQERLIQPDAKAGFVLDGYPRNIPQAQALDATLARLGRPLQLALLVDVDPGILTKRLTGRRVCEKCGAIFNVYLAPSKTANKCDQCGTALTHRSDDNENTVRSRLQVYTEQTVPLASYYKAQGKMRTVRGVGGVGEIFKYIVDIVESQIRPLAAVMSQMATPAKPKSRAKKAAGAMPEKAKPVAKTATAKPVPEKITKKPLKPTKKSPKPVVKKKALKAPAKKAKKKTPAKAKKHK